jgi:hypothetical protein
MISRERTLAMPEPFRLNAHDSIAQARRADTQRRQVAALKAWKPTDKPGWLNERFYSEKIQPRLAGIEVPTIVSALAVSEPYATNIRAGRRIPHPRHWLTLGRADRKPARLKHKYLLRRSCCLCWMACRSEHPCARGVLSPQSWCRGTARPFHEEFGSPLRSAGFLPDDS